MSCVHTVTQAANVGGLATVYTEQPNSLFIFLGINCFNEMLIGNISIKSRLNQINQKEQSKGKKLVCTICSYTQQVQPKGPYGR